MPTETKANLTNSEMEELKNKYKENVDSLWRQTFHIQPILGNLNDISCFYADKKNQYIYYNNDTLEEGRNNWYGVNIIDNVIMENTGLVLEPNLLWDNSSIESGSSFQEDDRTYFVYVGKSVGLQNEEKQYLLLAKKTEEGKLIKGKKPLFEINDIDINGNAKLIHADKYYVILSGTRSNIGKLYLYSSEELFKGWEFEGELKE